MILTWDAGYGEEFWLTRDYLRASIERDGRGFRHRRLARLVGADAIVEPVPVPHDCTDGFCGAFWRRPEAYLDPLVRAGIATWQLLADELGRGRGAASRPRERRLAARYASLAGLDELDVGYRIVRTP